MPTPRFNQVRCRYCQGILPGWFSILNVPNGAMLLHHLGQMHSVALKPLLERMRTEDIGTVAMEAFERLEDAEITAWLIGQLDAETLRAAIDEGLASGPLTPPAMVEKTSRS
jgi:hypothetical protein